MKNIRFILMVLICLLFVEACYIAPNPESDGTCSSHLKTYFLEITKESDKTKLQNKLQESMSYFENKPNFDTTKFTRSCLGDNVCTYTTGSACNSLSFSIENSDVNMLQYLLTAIKYETVDRVHKKDLMKKAIDTFKSKKTSKAAVKVIKMLQENGIYLDLEETIKSGDLETIKVLQENGFNLRNCDSRYDYITYCIDIAKNNHNSNEIYKYLEEQGYKTDEQLEEEKKATILQERQEQIKEQARERIEKVTELLKANKLEESSNECSRLKEVNIGDDSLKKRYNDLCRTQLVDKVRKLPKNKINSIELAKIYYDCDNEDNCTAIAGYVFQNDGKMLLMEHISLGHTIMVQHTGHIGKCQLEPNNMRIPFLGYAKYLGRKTYTSLLGNQSVPNYQLLFCESGY